jgi:hypothetical protein
MSLDELLGVIRSKPGMDRARILILSHTGSRAFGWGDERFDVDVHGVFALKGYWDYVHSGEKGFDLNLHEMDHLIWMVLYYKSGESVMNLFNPVYLDPGFRFTEMLELVNEEFFRIETAESELFRLQQYFHPRTALHAYRVMLVPIHFLTTRKPELNVFKINDALGLGLRGLEMCRDAYVNERNISKEEDRNLVWDELFRLLPMLYEAKKKHPGIKGDEWLRRWEEFRNYLEGEYR